MVTIPEKDIDLDNTPMSFGKHKGKTPREILNDDPDYIIWIVEDSEFDHETLFTEDVYDEARATWL